MTAYNFGALLEIAEISHHWFKATESIANHNSITRVQLKRDLRGAFEQLTKEPKL
jgi:hypothetical protein